MSIAQNLEVIKKNIEIAAAKSGRKASDITLLAVTKTRTAEEAFEAVKAGIFDLGENRVQEYIEKHDKVQHLVNSEREERNIKWHIIGHLQRNKVKYLIDDVHLIHSLDSYRLAQEISERASAAEKVIDVLVQVNAGDEEQKTGLEISECEDFVRNIKNDFMNINIRGLMAVVPEVDNPEDARRYFKNVKNLYDSLIINNGDILSFDCLSMGMTNDYKVAIEEGSTIVRIGTAIFGPR